MSSSHAASSHAFRQPLRLPKTTEEWDEANLLLQAEVVPAVLQASSSEEKDSILTTRTYEVLANRFGVRPPSKAQGRVQRKLKQHERALKKVTTLKNEARQALRRARREGECMTTVQRLTANFLSLLRTHSHLKRASANRLQLNKKRLARDECHRNFWHYAKSCLTTMGMKRYLLSFQLQQLSHSLERFITLTPISSRNLRGYLLQHLLSHTLRWTWAQS